MLMLIDFLKIYRWEARKTWGERKVGTSGGENLISTIFTDLLTSHSALDHFRTVISENKRVDKNLIPEITQFMRESINLILAGKLFSFESAFRNS